MEAFKCDNCGQFRTFNSNARNFNKIGLSSEPTVNKYLVVNYYNPEDADDFHAIELCEKCSLSLRKELDRIKSNSY